MIHDLWYKNGVIYCLAVGAFMDANDDGIGDFKGLMRRLDYLSGLGMSATRRSSIRGFSKRGRKVLARSFGSLRVVLPWHL